MADPEITQILDMLKDIQQRQESLAREQRMTYKQVEALLALQNRLTLRAPLPSMRGFAISPDFANIIVDVIEAYPPQHILELGGGVSTLIGGYCLQKQGSGRLISVDHTETFSGKTRENVLKHNLGNMAQVIHAPLRTFELHGEAFEWYDVSVIPTIQTIDLLIIDGPTQWDNPRRHVRYPALPLLHQQLASGALILIDDADREDEQWMVEQWLGEFPVEIVTVFDTEKGAKLLRWR